MEISLKEHEKFALQASLHLEYCECSVILFLLIEVLFHIISLIILVVDLHTTWELSMKGY